MISNIKRYSYLIAPFIILPIFIVFNNRLEFNNIDTLVSIAGALIGIMITNLTLYITFATNSSNINNVINSEHHKIFINNVNFGIIFFILCILVWLFNNFNKYDKIIIYLFIMGLVNIIISFYYITTMAKYLKKI